MEANLLKTPDIHKVDLVDDGANQEAKILLFKRRGMNNILSIFKRKPSPYKLLQENFVDLNAALGLEIESIMKSHAGDKSDDVHNAIQEYSDAIQKILFDDAVEIEKASTDERDERLKRIKCYRDGLTKLIKELDPEDEETDEPMVDETKPKETNDTKETKETMPEEAEEVDVDKSKMTPEDLVVMETLEKKYGPVVKAKTSEMSKRIADLEDQLLLKEEMEVAKKYADAGYDPVELAKSLVDIKKGNADFYAKYVESLDKAKTSIEKSKLFVEIGKRGNGKSDTGDVSKQIDQKAEEIRKNNPGLSFAQAKVKAYEDNPDLLRAYEGGN